MNTEFILPFLCELLAKSFPILLAAAVAVRVWRGATAAQRHLVWFTAIMTVLLLPMTRLVTPRWSVPLERKTTIRVSLPDLPLAPLVESDTPTVPVVAAPPPRHWTMPDWRKVFPGVWLAGAVLILGYRWLGSWRLHRLGRNSGALDDARVQELTSRVLRELQIDRPIRIRISDECRVPMTWGAWRPVLLLPAEALQWSETRLVTALRHEAGHISRQDYVVRWITHVACVVYWPNPLVWLATRALRVAQEQATDDLVLRAGTPPEEYAEQLVEAARTVAMGGYFVRNAVAMASPSTLAGRVLAIVDGERDRRPLSRRAAAIGAMGVAGALAICTVAQLQGEDRGPRAEKESPGTTTANQNEPQVEINAKFVELAPEGAPAGGPLSTVVDRAIYSDPQFQVIVRELNKKKGVDLLSSPGLTTRSKQQVKVEIVREFRYPVEWEKEEGVVIDGLNQVRPLEWKPKKFETKNTGVTLEIMPEIKADGSIELQLKPHVTEFDGFVDLDDPKAFRATDVRGKRTRPVFAEGEVDAKVTLKSGETVALSNIQEMADGKPVVEGTHPNKLVVFVSARIINPAPEQAVPPQSPGKRANLDDVGTQIRAQLQKVQQMGKQQTSAAAMQRLLELVDSPRPDELLDPLRVPKIDDPTIAKTFPLLQEAITEEARLTSAGLDATHPRMKALEEQKGAYVKILSEQLARLRNVRSYTSQLGTSPTAQATSAGVTTQGNDASQSARAAANAAALARSPMAQKAAGIIIPKLEFREATPRETIDFLRKKSRALSADGEGVNIVLNLSASADLARITLSLTEVPLLEAVRYIAGVTDLPLDLQPNALVIGAPLPPPDSGARAESKPKPDAATIPLDEEKARINITADSTRMENGIAIAEGDVSLKRGTTTITAEIIRYNPEKHSAQCDGKVEVNDGVSILRGDKMEVVFGENDQFSVTGTHTVTMKPENSGIPGIPGLDADSPHGQ